MLSYLRYDDRILGVERELASESDFSPIVPDFADVDSIEILQNVVQANPKDPFVVTIHFFLHGSERETELGNAHVEEKGKRAT